jgi:PAS domain S-box-containing protein
MVNGSAIEKSIPEFLTGGGEMGQRIRDYDWAASPLGPVETWPQSLRTCVRIMLTSRQPIWIGWGPDLIKLYNDPYIAIVGGKHPWALGRPASVVWKDIWKDIEPMLKQVMEQDQGTYVESQLLIMERNGYPEETYYTFSYTPIPGDDGATAGMICANSDDTDRIVSERQLKTLTQLGKSLTDAKSINEIVDGTMNTLRENQYDFPFSLLYTIDGSRAVLAGTTEQDGPTALMPTSLQLDADSELATILNAAISTRRLQVFADIEDKMGAMPRGAWEIAPDKAIILPIMQASSRDAYGVLVVGFNPYRLLDDKYAAFFSLVADQVATSFADAYVLEEERKRAAALAEIDKAKTTFFSNISHEFRTPLTLLLGPIEDALNDPATTPANAARLELAHRNAQRMQKLVNALLDFSRIEAGRMEGQYVKVDIGTLTEDLASTFRSAIEKAGMQLSVHLSPIKDDVYVDVDMWEKIVLNLVSNAFKYSKEGSITVDVSQRGTDMRMQVTDTGVGIPSDQLENIFSRFHRVEHTEGRSQEGTGIGLSMVKELVKLHGGTIAVSSEPGKGSTFTINIPTGKEHLAPGRVRDEVMTPKIGDKAAAYVNEAEHWLPGKTQKPVENSIGQPGEHKSRVLLADDNADMRDYLNRLLSEHFDVITAVNGEEAFERMVAYKPELLLTDVMMPKLDGFGLLQKVRGNPELRNTPVIFLSARAGEEAKVEGLDAGADDYMVKPFSARELIGRVASHIRISKVRRETEHQFFQLFQQAPVIINLLKGPEHRYQLFHPKNKELLGDVDFTGKTVREAMPELEGQGILEILDEVYNHGKTFEEPERLVVLKHKDGRSLCRYFNTNFQPWYDGNRRIQGVMLFVVDVTDMVAARKAIEESENRFRMLAETLPQLAWMADGNGQQMYVSNRWKEYSGVDVDPELWLRLVHPNDIDGIMKTWQRAMEKRSKYNVELRLKNKQGEYRWFHGQAEPAKDEYGNVIKWVGAFTDIQDQKNIEKRLEQLVAERTVALQQSNEDLQQFAHVASHDLKEPVRKVKTFSGRLQDEYGELLPDKARLFLEKIQVATDRMYSMIDGVLSYSTLNARRELPALLDLNEVVGSIIVDLELAIQQKDAQLKVSKLPVIEGAAVLIYQLLYNLINNSLKFSKDSERPIISVYSTTESDTNHMATIVVADNGIGFDQEYADRIFDTFTRLNAKDKYEGTGLGLALCKKIVERHHGTIEAIGKRGEGAAFIINLPFKQGRII